MKTYSKVVILALALIGTGFLPVVASAKTVQWTQASGQGFAYYNDWFGNADVCFSDYTEVGSSCKNVGGPSEPLFQINGQDSESQILSNEPGNWYPGMNTTEETTVTYGATITNDSTGETVNDGDTIPQGTQLTFTFTPHQSSDISWFGQGYTADSPYGDWVSTLVPTMSEKSQVDYKLPKYNQQDQSWDIVDEYADSYYAGWFDTQNDDIGKGLAVRGSGGKELETYVQLRLLPPAETLKNTTGLTCGSPQNDGQGNITEDCTVSGSGTISPIFDFAATSGNFFYGSAGSVDNNAYQQSGDVFWVAHPAWPIFGNNIPMRSATINYDSGSGEYYATNIGSSDYNLPVTDEQIQFTFSGGTNNNPPTTPQLTCPGPVQVGQPATLTVVSTDPDGDQIRYGMDWTQSGTVNEWDPASGYVNSGTQESPTHTWNTAGTYPVNALAEDVHGADSAWTSTPCNVVVQNSGPTLACTPSPGSGTAGVTPIKWTATDSGFTPPITFNWKSNGGMPATGVGNPFKNVIYSSAGVFSAHVNASDSSGDKASADCSPVTILTGQGGGGGDCGKTPAVTITAAEPRVVSGTQDTISWTATGIAQGDECDINGPGIATIKDYGNSSCDINDNSGHSAPLINGQSTYTISCSVEGVTGSVTVDVVPGVNEY